MDNKDKMILKYGLKTIGMRLLHINFILNVSMTILVINNTFNISIYLLALIDTVIVILTSIFSKYLMIRYNAKNLTYITTILFFIIFTGWNFVDILWVKIIVGSVLVARYCTDKTIMDYSIIDMRSKYKNNDPEVIKDINEMRELTTKYRDINKEISDITDNVNDYIPTYDDFMNTDEVKRIILMQDWYDDDVILKIFDNQASIYFKNAENELNYKLDFLNNEKHEINIKLNELHHKYIKER